MENGACSNPLAGTDSTLLALAGTGYSDMRAFGFACCERAVGAAEGINVLMERKVAGEQGPEFIYNVTNLEYTEFEKYGFTDECEEGSGFSRYPANTNVLYVSLKVRHVTMEDCCISLSSSSTDYCT